jgi:hypothetical protein
MELELGFRFAEKQYNILKEPLKFDTNRLLIKKELQSIELYLALECKDMIESI